MYKGEKECFLDFSRKQMIQTQGNDVVPSSFYVLRKVAVLLFGFICEITLQNNVGPDLIILHFPLQGAAFLDTE